MKAWEYILRLPDGSRKGVEHIVHPDMVVLGMLEEVMVVLGMLKVAMVRVKLLVASNHIVGLTVVGTSVTAPNRVRLTIQVALGSELGNL